MKPLAVLIISFLITLLVTRLFYGDYNVLLAARIGMSSMLLFTAIAHFAFTKGMSMMVPGFIPFKTAVVYLTGIAEIIAAITLLIPSCAYITGWFLIGFFLLLLPANINAAIKRIDYQKGSFEGKGLNYLWFRVPLQILFIGWVYFAAIKFHN